jgi:low affinity Fe/Cu permease
MKLILLVLLVNALNVIDAVQTYIGYCVEANPLMSSPLALHIKVLVVLIWSLVLYRAGRSSNVLVSKTARAMLILLAIVFLIAVMNNALVLMNVRC